MKFSCSDGKEVVWEDFVDDTKENAEIGLQCFSFNVFDEYEGGEREKLYLFTYL